MTGPVEFSCTEGAARCPRRLAVSAGDEVDLRLQGAQVIWV
jgi:hypothetical protein